MAIAKGTNSYSTVSEADSYFADRIDVAAWTEAPEAEKAKALVTATSYLDTLTWVGTAVSETQPLAFPRYGSYFDPKVGFDIQMVDSTIPNRIVIATFELAYHLLNNDGLLDDSGTVKNISLGDINLSSVYSANKIPGIVKRIIRPLLENKSSSIWWRAN